MLEPCYKYDNKGSAKDIYNNLQQIFTFKSKIINQQYIVEVINYKHNIYVIQFYLKTHRLSKNRFSLLIPKKKNSKNNNKHVFYLLNTIVNISYEIIKQNPKASFAFMGAPTIDESDIKKNKININPDNTIKNTKRYKVYSLYVKRYYSPEKFTHIEYLDSSCYLLKNNDNEILTKEKADDYVNYILTFKND